MTTAVPTFLARVVGWLRAGYPGGAPERGYLPLFGLLGSQLTNDEVTLIAQDLALSSTSESDEETKKAVSAITGTTISSSGTAQVRRHLAPGGSYAP
jgi:hypothetical protein